MRPGSSFLVSMALAGMLGSACNQALPAGAGPGFDAADMTVVPPDLGPPPPPDLIDNGNPSTTYPAKFPDPPQVLDTGGPTLRSPEIVPIFYSNDNAKLVLETMDFLTVLGPSDFWKAATSEYGVGPAVVTPMGAINLVDVGPKTIDDSAIQTWLRTKLNGNDPTLPAANKNSIYVFHYPAGTSVTISGGGRSCSSFGGYHGEVRLDANHSSLLVAYAVVPRCNNGYGGVNDITAPESHELIEAATDPYPYSRPAYSMVDADHIYWAFLIGGGETGDMCEANASSFGKVAGLPYVVQRSWSNAAILAGHDPCVPAPAGEVYFNAVPDLQDAVTLAQGYSVLGVNIPVGTSRTINLYLFSDGDTGGPFTVDVSNARPNSAFLDFSLDRDSGINGEILHLTITSSVQSTRGSAAFIVRSQRGGSAHIWYGEVGQP